MHPAPMRSSLCSHPFYANLLGTSPQPCFQKCQKTMYCRAALFNYASTRCYLYSRPKEMKRYGPAMRQHITANNQQSACMLKPDVPSAAEMTNARKSTLRQFRCRTKACNLACTGFRGFGSSSVYAPATTRPEFHVFVTACGDWRIMKNAITLIRSIYESSTSTHRAHVHITHDNKNSVFQHVRICVCIRSCLSAALLGYLHSYFAVCLP